MAPKLIYANETSFAHTNETEEVNLQDWRAAKEVKNYYTYNGNRLHGVIVVLKSFRSYFIYDFTLDRLLYENNFDNILDIPYEYVKNFLSCLQCNASGKVDWIENATGEKEHKNMKHNYELLYDASEYVKVDISNKSSYYIGVPYLNIGDKICKKCNGSGIDKRSTLWLS